MTRQLSLRLLAIGLLLSVGAGCFGGGATTSAEKITLDYWRVYDDESSFKDIISAYQVLHPNVTIHYRKLRAEEYESELVRSIADGKGPDIFSVHNTKIGEFQSLMAPMPSSVTVSYLETKGTIRKETSLVQRVEPTLSEKSLKENYVDVVDSDVVRSYQPDPKKDPEMRIFGLPLSVDSLVLFSNKDLLDAAGVVSTPVTWDQFQDAVRKITVYDDQGGITQSAAALGTTANVERSSDILSLLMMQNGTQMTDERGRVAFQTIPEGTPNDIFPGIDAARFYTDFANPIKDVYTWNDRLPNSLEAFANGQTAFFFGYSYDIPLIEAAAPRLDYAISKAPQITGGKQANFANYWVEGVSRTSLHQDYAWDFVQFAASQDQVDSYLTRAQKPTALRGLINSQLNDEHLGPFAEQVLTSDSWYRGNDSDAAEAAINTFSDNLLAGEDPVDSIKKAADAVADTYQ